MPQDRAESFGVDACGYAVGGKCMPHSMEVYRPDSALFKDGFKMVLHSSRIYVLFGSGKHKTVFVFTQWESKLPEKSRNGYNAIGTGAFG